MKKSLFLQSLLQAFTVTVLFFAFIGADALPALANGTVSIRPNSIAPRPQNIGVASVSLSAPAQSFLGEDVSFSVTFDNTGTDEGYGPFIDVYLDATGADGDDGIGTTTITAAYQGAPIPAADFYVLTFNSAGQATHPILRDATGAFVIVTGDPGDRLVVVRLPFGSFTPAQPPATVNFTVNMSNLADVNVPLTIRARGGYQFGQTPLDDWCCGDPPDITLSAWQNSSVTPILITLSKSYNGPEDETATGPNFPRQYTVTATIAPGQSLTGFTLTDTLPDSVQFISVTSTTPGGAVCTTPGATTPGGTVTCTYPGSVSGTASMTINFYIPRLNSAGGEVINPLTGDDVTSCNNAQTSGNWTPIDPRDPLSSNTVNPGGCEHLLSDKSIAVQKGATVVGGGTIAPTRTIEYTLNFQVSDFFAFDQVVLIDTFSDGQRFDTTFAPTLLLNGNAYTLAAAAMNTANVAISCNYTGAVIGAGCTTLNPAPNDGTTTITFNISGEALLRAGDGRLTGGCVDPVNGSAAPDCTVYNNGATNGQILFRTVVQENFSDDYPSGDPSVDQGDTLTNQSTITGQVLNTATFSATGNSEEDASQASLSIPRGVLEKTIYAVNGNTTFSSPVRVNPTDTLTYRLRFSMPTSDIESLTLRDWLPLPVFFVGDPDDDGVPGPAWSFDPTVSTAAPPSGVAKFGPADTFYAYSGLVPSVSADIPNNALVFTYGDFDDTRNQATTVDILFTVSVSNDPFADGLYLTNQALASEGSTNSGAVDSNAIVQIILNEPVLVTTKGVVWTNNSTGIFNPDPPAPVAFLAPDNAPRWNPALGIINSTTVDALPIDSDLSGVDAGDLVTFAILVRNTGSSLRGAFDIVVNDVLQPEYQIPSTPEGLNLQIYYGNGTGPIPYLGLGGGPDGLPNTADDLFGNGIELVDPNPSQGVCQAHDPNLGNDIIIITYDLQLRDDVIPGDIINTAGLLNYSGTEGGPNYLPETLTNSATVSVDQPQIVKTLQGTEIDNAVNSASEAVIGEIATYQVVLTIPEGQLPAALLVDTLDPGLALVDCLSVTSSADLTTTYPGGFAAMCNPGVNPTTDASGNVVTFDLGTLTNNNRDNTIDETITFEYRVVILNTLSNQAGTNLNNLVELQWTNGSASTSANDLTVIEPVLAITKTGTPPTIDADNPVTFNVTVSNGTAAGDTDAFEVTWSDTIPAYFIYTPGSFRVDACSAPTPTLSDAAAPTLTATWSSMAPGQSCTLSFDVTVAYSVTPGQVLNNTAEARWTSLAGAPGQRSSFNASSTERTGEDGLLDSGALNDYRVQGTGGVTVTAAAPQKFLVSTSEAHTSLGAAEYVSIGEIVRYRIAVQLPEGTIPNFQIRDLLPGGLTFLNDNTARAVFVSNVGITSTPIGIIPAFNDPACNLIGSSVDAVNPAIPGVCVLADNAVGASLSTTVDNDAFGNSTDPYFKFGNLVNNDSDSDAEYVVVELNALVNNTVGGSNDAGDNRNNFGRAYVNGVQSGADSNLVQVRIAEPLLNIVKTADIDPTQDAGDAVVYTLTLTSDASSPNRTTAFDISLTDLVDANLAINAVNVSSTQGALCVGNGAGTTNFVTAATTVGQLVTVTASCLDPGQSITVQINATVTESAPAGYTLPNTVNLVYTSLPGDAGTAPNPTGSVVPGAPGSGTGERTGSGVAPNDYTASSSANLTLNIPAFNKVTPIPAQYAIGEEVTFNLLVTLPEGTTQALVVSDDLPAGLAYVSGSAQVITAAALSGGLLIADFNGSFSNTPPVFSAPGGSGGDVSWDFGDALTPGDNNPDNNSFVVQLRALVLDEMPGNIAGATLTNTASLTYLHATNGTTTLTDSEIISLVEATITTTKTIVDPPGFVQAGDTVTYLARFENTGTSTAYEVTAEDTLAQGMAFGALLTCLDQNGAAVPSTVTDNGATVNFDGNPAGSWDIPVGGFVACTYTAVAQTSLVLDSAHTNTIDADWTSTNGTNTSERNYNDTTVYPNDGTQDTASATFNSGAPTIAKDDNGVTQAVIGQTIFYTLTINSPSGTLRQARVVDVLPAGTIYVAGSQSVSAGISPATFTVSTPNDGSAPVTLTWDFGDAVVTNSPITITYNALVANVAGNQSLTPLVNDVTLSYQNGAGQTQILTASENLSVIEPTLTIDKSLSTLAVNPGVGDVVNYTVTLQNPSGGEATAYEADFIDTLPAQVDLDVTSITVNAGSATVTNNSNDLTNTVAITISDIPVGVTAVITYQATILSTVTPGELVENTATARWSSLPGNVNSGATDGERDGSGGINDYTTNDTASFTSNATATLVKDDGAVTQAVIGQNIHYTLTIESPLGTVPNAQVVDILPAGIIYVPGSQTVSANITPAVFSLSSPNDGSAPVTLTWDFGNALVSSTPFTIEYDAVVANVTGNQEGTLLINDVTFSFQNASGATQTLTASENVTVIEPVLNIIKSVSNPTPGFGEIITYTLEISHTAASNADAFDLVITDVLPVGLNYVAGSAAPAGWSPSYDPGTRTLTFTGDLPLAAGSITLTYQATVDAGVAIGAVLTNTASVVWTSTPGANSNERNGSEGVSGALNNYASETNLTITFTTSDLSITKDDGGITVSPGDPVVYSLVYANIGNTNATNVVITETVPAFATFNLASSSGGWSCPDGAPAGTTCTLALGILTPGATGSVDFAVTVISPVPAGLEQIENTARIAGSEVESNLTNNEDTDTTPILASPALEVTKDDGVTIVSPEQTVVYVLTVTNTGDQDASGVVLTDTLPDEVIFISASDLGAESGGVVTWPTFNLAAGASRSFNLTVKVKNEVDLQGATSMTNLTHVEDDGSNTGGTPIVDDDDDTDQIAYARVKALVATSEVDSFDPNPAREPIFVGEILTYEINLLVPEGDLPGLTAVDILDPGLAFVSCQSISYGTLTTNLPGGFETACNDPLNPSVTAEPVGSTDPENQGRRIVFDFGDVTNPAGSGDQLLTVRYQVVALNIAANVNGRQGLKNALTWEWASGSLTGSASTPSVDIIEPILVVEKTVSSSTVLMGEEITFRINLSHDPQSRANAYDVIVADPIPSGLSYIANSASASGVIPIDISYDPVTRTLTVAWDSLPLGASSSVTFRARFVGPSPVINTARVTWTSLPAELLPTSRLTDYNLLSTERHFEPANPTGVNSYGRSASVNISLVQELPATGFAPGIRTSIPAQPAESAYHALSGVRLEIPSLNLDLPVTGIPLNAQGWDLTWLANQAGYLEGTAYPGQVGNTALTAHTYLADGNPGPFLHLNQLIWGQQIILHANGYRYIYEVRQNQVVNPNNVSVLYKNDGYAWLTLITCKGFNERNGAYNYRIVVRAVLVKVEPER